MPPGGSSAVRATWGGDGWSGGGWRLVR
jgi:hypothetical protein